MTSKPARGIPNHRPIKRIENRQATERCIVDSQLWPCRFVTEARGIPLIDVEPADLEWLMLLIIARIDNSMEYHRAKDIIMRLGGHVPPGTNMFNAAARLASESRPVEEGER